MPRSMYMSMCSVTQGDADSDSGAHSAGGSGSGGAGDEVLRAHAREVVTKYLELSADLDALKRQAAVKRKERDGLESTVKAALSDLETEALNIRGVGGVDIVHQRRKAVLRVEDYIRTVNSISSEVASSVKAAMDSKRQFVEKEILRVVKPK